MGKDDFEDRMNPAPARSSDSAASSAEFSGLGPVRMGNHVLNDDFKLTGGLREYVRWGGNPIGNLTTETVFFGSVRAMCTSRANHSERYSKAEAGE